MRARNVDAVPALPDGSPELIFNLADPFQAFAVEGVGQVQPPIMLVGQISAPFVVGPTGRVDLVAVRLQSYGAALLHPPVSLLTDGWTDPDRAPLAGHQRPLGGPSRCAAGNC